jgi:pre-mRNA-splicing factor ATP-dependent RNA helicase DHX16
MPPKVRNPEDLNDLRLRSRQDYLGKREEQSLLLLAKQVEEEAEEERSNKKLSKQELESFRHNRELLELVRSRQAVDEHRDGYLLPDSTLSDKTQILNRRDEKNNHISEVEQWENEQVSKIRSQIKTKEKEQEEDYEYVFDENVGIKWDAANYVDPEMQQLKKTLDLAEKKAKTMKEVRESLPVFAFKEQLISAVADHQILIICGETGSGKTVSLKAPSRKLSY